MNKLKYLNYIAVSLLLAVGFTSCNDDDLGEAPRLFRPIASLSQVGQSNNMKAEWTRLGGLKGFEVQLYQLATDSSVIVDGQEPIVEEVIEESAILFEGYPWDERYILRVKAIGETQESRYYETDYVTLSYPTALTSVRLSDVAVIVTWTDPTSRGQQPYTPFVLTGEDGPHRISSRTDQASNAMERLLTD